MVSHMVFLTKLGFENLKNLVTSTPWETKSFQGLDYDFGLKRPTHHLDPEYVHLLRAKKYGIWGDFSEKFQVLCKNPDEVTRFDGIGSLHWVIRTKKVTWPGSSWRQTRGMRCRWRTCRWRPTCSWPSGWTQRAGSTGTWYKTLVQCHNYDSFVQNLDIKTITVPKSNSKLYLFQVKKTLLWI